MSPSRSISRQQPGQTKCVVLVAVEPVVLEGALAHLINRAQIAEAVQGHACPGALQRRYAAAVVSLPPPKGIRARVMIELSDTGIGKTRVRTGRSSRWETVLSHQDILAMIERYCTAVTTS